MFSTVITCRQRKFAKNSFLDRHAAIFFIKVDSICNIHIGRVSTFERANKKDITVVALRYYTHKFMFCSTVQTEQLRYNLKKKLSGRK